MDQRSISCPWIEGLTIQSDFISQEEHDQIIKQLDDRPWLNDIARRVQHYGYKFE